MTTVNIREFGGYELSIFKTTVRLAGGMDTVYVIAVHSEDAVRQVRRAYEDLNVLYLESLERLTGSFYISEEARAVMKAPTE
jgi:hypothetical protein